MLLEIFYELLWYLVNVAVVLKLTMSRRVLGHGAPQPLPPAGFRSPPPPGYRPHPNLPQGHRGNNPNGGLQNRHTCNASSNHHHHHHLHHKGLAMEVAKIARQVSKKIRHLRTFPKGYLLPLVFGFIFLFSLSRI